MFQNLAYKLKHAQPGYISLYGSDKIMKSKRAAALQSPICYVVTLNEGSA